ncbi:MAG TPA: hypothetical protein VNS33_16485 [Bradyrhizobium sp.]|nr:hypothetical protein [Bradyrhizobium sp.]
MSDAFGGSPPLAPKLSEIGVEHCLIDQVHCERAGLPRDELHEGA